jgi:hypothetical protein
MSFQLRCGTLAQLRGRDFEIIGLLELESQFARIGKMPKKHLTSAAKAGMKPILVDAKANAPIGETGVLKKSIKAIMETPNKRNKTVYRAWYDPKYTDHFRKPTTGVYGGRTPYAYYPASVEYGFKTAKGKIKGQYSMNWAVQKNEQSSVQIVVDKLHEAIDELTN